MVQNSYQTSPRKWYNNPRFPLVPQLQRRMATTKHTASFSFRWLFFQCWSLDHIELEFSLVCSMHWGIGIIGILPYLRWAVAIPFPYAVENFLYDYFKRQPLPKDTLHE